MKHISPRMLKYNILYQPFIGHDIDGVLYDESILLNKVIIDFSLMSKEDKISQNHINRSSIIYDCYHSRPSGLNFTIDDKFIFNGFDLYVRSIKVFNNNYAKPIYIMMECE